MSPQLRVRPNPTMSMFSGIGAMVMVLIGVTVVIPRFGAFGVLWTVAAAVGAVVSFMNAFGKHGVATEVIDVPDSVKLGSDTEPRTIEDRLRQLADLEERGVITADEHAKRRAEILAQV